MSHPCPWQSPQPSGSIYPFVHPQNWQCQAWKWPLGNTGNHNSFLSLKSSFFVPALSVSHVSLTSGQFTNYFCHQSKFCNWFYRILRFKFRDSNFLLWKFTGSGRTADAEYFMISQAFVKKRREIWNSIWYARIS